MYGDPRPWTADGRMPARASACSTSTKYPASLLFLLMTLGPDDRAPAARSSARAAWSRTWLATFGRVPFFYYLLHIPLIHARGAGRVAVREGRVNPWLFANHPMMPPPFPPVHLAPSAALSGVAIVVALLYVPCRWFAESRVRQPSAWKRFL